MAECVYSLLIYNLCADSSYSVSWSKLHKVCDSRSVNQKHLFTSCVCIVSAHEFKRTFDKTFMTVSLLASVNEFSNYTFFPKFIWKKRRKKRQLHSAPELTSIKHFSFCFVQNYYAFSLSSMLIVCIYIFVKNIKHVRLHPQQLFV